MNLAIVYNFREENPALLLTERPARLIPISIFAHSSAPSGRNVLRMRPGPEHYRASARCGMRLAPALSKSRIYGAHKHFQLTPTHNSLQCVKTHKNVCMNMEAVNMSTKTNARLYGD